MSANSIPTITPAVSSGEFIIIGMETTSLPTMQAENGHVIGILCPAYHHRVYWMDDHLVLRAGRAMVEFLTFGITNDGVRATHTMIHLPGMSELEAHDLLQRINNVSEQGISDVTGLLDRSHGTFLVDIEIEMDWQPDDVLVKVIALLEAAITR